MFQTTKLEVQHFVLLRMSLNFPTILKNQSAHCNLIIIIMFFHELINTQLTDPLGAGIVQWHNK